MTIQLSTPLVLALRAEYPGCAPDAESMSDLVDALLFAGLTRNAATRRAIADAEREDALLYPGVRDKVC